MSISDEVLGYDTLLDLGVKTAPLIEKMPAELEIHKKYGHYHAERLVDEMPASLPKPLTRVEERKFLAEEKMGFLGV